uniref:Uncharacterized protein n=1 Tax=Arundo donax TaxID=35708 RepID=A0A0A9GPA6_ARUDO
MHCHIMGGWCKPYINHITYKYHEHFNLHTKRDMLQSQKLHLHTESPGQIAKHGKVS